MVMIVAILALLLACTIYVLITIFRLGKEQEEVDRQFERNKLNAQHIENTQRVLSIREGKVREKEKLYKNLIVKHIQYAVSQSDYMKYTTPSLMKRHIKEVLAKSLVRDLDLDKDVTILTSNQGTDLYDFVYYIKDKADN